MMELWNAWIYFARCPHGVVYKSTDYPHHCPLCEADYYSDKADADLYARENYPEA